MPNASEAADKTTTLALGCRVAGKAPNNRSLWWLDDRHGQVGLALAAAW